MGIGYAYGKNILIGDQFVLNGVPAIVSALPFKTETKVERLPEGSDLIIVDNRNEVPGYIKKKAAKCRLSYERMIEKEPLYLGCELGGSTRKRGMSSGWRFYIQTLS